MIKHIFIASSQKKCIEYWQLSKLNILNRVQKIYTYGNVQPLLYEKTKKLLYAGIRHQHYIIIYKLIQNKYLKKIQKFKISCSLNHFHINKEKTILFGASYHYNKLNIYSLNHDGLIQKKINKISNILGCHSSCLNINNNILFLASLKKNLIYTYQIYFKNTYYYMHKKHSFLLLKKKSGPRHIISHPSQNYIYSLNELNGTIDIWKIINISLKIFKIQSISLIPFYEKKKFWSSEILIHPTGKFLYASDRIKNMIFVFKINNCNFTLKFLKYYITDTQPRSFHIDDTGKYLISVGQKSNTLTIYDIKINGLLTPIIHKNIVQDPIWVLIY
ncbi:beta-propeller fold lactonase family protein [Buchnera aphidicola]|uniref:beta-propeller fold lactonase family protein n=1 Tax=Buchnera aphidicola TaxID=9 RepID=UPI00313ED90A